MCRRVRDGCLIEVGSLWDAPKSNLCPEISSGYFRSRSKRYDLGTKICAQPVHDIADFLLASACSERHRTTVADIGMIEEIAGCSGRVEEAM